MEFSKLSGIYQIRNTINNKKYIGHSINITLRWYLHLFNLIINKHDNPKLQEDFNTYGIKNFELSILELFTGTKHQLKKLEQEYLNKLDFDLNYSIHNSITDEAIINKQMFIDYINDKWVMPDGITYEELDKYRIYKNEDKQEIIDMAVKSNIIPLFKSQITFNKVMTYVKNFGYNVISDRKNICNKKLTYKIILNTKFTKHY